MNQAPNDKIKQFLTDIRDISAEQYEIIISLRELIRKVKPDAEEEIKYGGLVFNSNQQLITGIFIRKEHISLEFSFGAGFEDKQGFLEGNGKFRRHLKINHIGDIQNKDAETFVNFSFLYIE